MHDKIHEFWSKSIGSWQSKLAVLTVDWLDNQELLLISKIHDLAKTDFGIKMSWKYKNKNESGYAFWGIERGYSNSIFSSTDFKDNDMSRVLTYQMINLDKLVTISGEYEERFFLETEKKRLRELRYAGRLIRRIKEERVDFEASMP